MSNHFYALIQWLLNARYAGGFGGQQMLLGGFPGFPEEATSADGAIW